MLKGRSVCPHCKHELAPKDLVPALSWLWLKGKCRYCGQRIDDNPLIELITPLLFVTSYIYWPLVFSGKGTVLFGFWVVFLVGFIALAAYDLRWYLLPDKIIKPFLILSIIQTAVLLIYNASFGQFMAVAFSALIGGGIFYAIFQISNGKWIGGGDVKLGTLLGLVLADAQLMVLTIFAASLIGTALTVPMLISGKFKRTTKIPFGPLLITGAMIARLFGISLINWYKRKLLIY